MKSYKKLFITLIIVFASVFSVGLSSPKVFAEQEKKVETQMFLPSTYFEFFQLNQPVDICSDEENIYIAEKDAIVVYNRSTQIYTRIDCQSVKPHIEWEITKIDCYKGNVFFLNRSKVCYISLSDLTTIVDCNLYSAKYFHISGNRIYTDDSSFISSWTINYTDGQFTFGTFNTVENAYMPNITFNNTANSVAYVYSPISSFLYYFTSIDCSKVSTDTFSANIFTHSTQYSEFYNGKIYFTKNNRLYEYDENLSTAPTELFCLPEGENYINGFTFENGKVLVVNTVKNEIWEFDLASSDFTGTFVATFKDTANRLTADVIDTVVSDDYLYVLQKTGISKLALDQTSQTKITFPTDFSVTEFNPLYLSVIENKLLLSNGNKLKIFTLTDLEDSTTATESVISTIGTWEENNISGLYAFDREFYILKNRTIDNIQYAVIYKIDKNATGYQINSERYLYKKEGTGINFTINSFGELYLLSSVNNLGKKITRYDLINKEENLINTPLGDGVKKIISDFENVFVLNENTVYNVTSNEYYKIEKSTNFNQLDTPISFTVDLNSGITYFLYKGYILQTSDLPLKNSNTYAVPAAYNTTFNQSPVAVTMSEGAKIFLVDGNSEEYFKCEHVTSATQKDYIFITELSGGFCLIGLEENIYLSRIQDVKEKTLIVFTPKFNQGYYVTKSGKYVQPMLNLIFKIADVNAYQAVTIDNGLTVNGEDFYQVTFSDGSKGYVQTTFIVEHLSEQATTENYYFANCYDCTVYDIDGTVIGSLKESKIKVYGQENDFYKISYGDSIGYIKADAIVTPKNNALRNTLLIMIVATSFTVTAIYLLIRYYRKFKV